MGGVGAQGKRKAARRAAAMSPSLDELHAADVWRRPPASECEEENYTSELSSVASDGRLKIRMVRHHLTWALVEFAIVYQVQHRGRWCDVAEIDSRHNVDAHCHRYGRSTGARIGDPEVLMAISNIDDVAKAYELAMDYIEQSASTLRSWWHHG